MRILNHKERGQPGPSAGTGEIWDFDSNSQDLVPLHKIGPPQTTFFKDNCLCLVLLGPGSVECWNASHPLLGEDAEENKETAVGLS